MKKEYESKKRYESPIASILKWDISDVVSTSDEIDNFVDPNSME